MQPHWTQLTAQHKIITMHPISLANFTATEFNKIFSGREPHQGVKFLQCFRDWFRLELVPETLENFHTLTRLSAREDFIEPCVLIKALHLWLLNKSPVWYGLTLSSTVATIHHLLSHQNTHLLPLPPNTHNLWILCGSHNQLFP